MNRTPGILSDPVRRRLLTIRVSGGLIAVALVTRYGFGGEIAWVPLMVVAALVAGADIARRAWATLRLRQLGIELLVTIAAAGALVMGEPWEAAAVTFLFATGAWLEARTMRRTRGALTSLLSAAPEVATVIRDGAAVEVAPGSVRVGETVLVKPGQRIPVDGTVSEGSAAVDEGAITGESIPAEKTEGSRVWAGSIARDGLLRIVATEVGGETTLARVVRRVEEAQEERAPAQRAIERFARWYTPGIAVLAVLTFLVTSDARLALTLLVVGCPGALVIATPLSVVAGIGRAAREGILIRGGAHLESVGRVTALALDKTGTLTSGSPRVVEILVPARTHVVTSGVVPGGLEPAWLGGGSPIDDDAWRGGGARATGRDGPGVTQVAGGWTEAQEYALRLAAAAESGSDHPLARAIVEAALPLGALGQVGTLTERAGLGVRAEVIGSGVVEVGSRRLLESSGVVLDVESERELAALRSRGRTPVLVAVNGELAGILGLADTVRPSAAPMVSQLQDAGVDRVAMLTGDDSLVARQVARETGIEEVHSGLLPEEKLELVRRMGAQGFRVAMVGDGINDAPALAAAHTSIAMGLGGSDVAVETADIALLTGDLRGIPRAIELSRATLANMRQNLAIALATVAVLLVGVLGGRVHMAGGMLVHQLSVLAVIANAARLLRGL